MDNPCGFLSMLLDCVTVKELLGKLNKEIKKTRNSLYNNAVCVYIYIYPHSFQPLKFCSWDNFPNSDMVLDIYLT